MLANRTKLITTVSLGVLLFIFGCLGLAQIIHKGSQGNLPLRVLRITIDVNQHQELFAQLRKFANQHDFKIFIRKVDVIPEGIFIEMYRDDIEILAGNAASDPTMIDLGLYERNPKHPTHKETIDDLVSDLKSFISAIPNATISEE